MHLKNLPHLAGLVIAAALIGTATDCWSQASYFQMTSPAFQDNGIMASKYAGKNPANPNCVGENLSPPLEWSNAPAGTKSFALIKFDQEGRLGLGVTHWLAYGIPASMSSMPEGVANLAIKPFVNGLNILKKPEYLGACPPKGTGPHHYVFTLIATSLEPDALKSGLTQQELMDSIGSKALGATGLIGRFGH
jgi:Raf kinase inhibitor-like YbhB/YbcL family protein